MQHAYANNTIAQLAMLRSIQCFPKLKTLNLLVADSGKKVQSKGPLLVAMQGMGATSSMRVSPAYLRVPGKRCVSMKHWNRTLKFEKDYIYLYLLGLTCWLDLIDITRVPASKGKLKL